MKIATAIIDLMSFSEWATRKYVEWRGSAISGRTIAEFARFIGISQPHMSDLLTGKRMPGRKTLKQFADKYGHEAFEAAGVAPEGQVPMDRVPSSVRKRLRQALREINTTLEARGIDDPDSPEALKVTSEIMDRFGFTLREIETTNE